MSAENSNDWAIVIVDHGSKRKESNDKLVEMVDLFIEHTEHKIVEPAHMELASPSIADAFDRCIERGATRVMISPFFLLPGRHWTHDIPALAAEAAAKHPGVEHRVAAPLGLHRLMAQMLKIRIDEALED